MLSVDPSYDPDTLHFLCSGIVKVWKKLAVYKSNKNKNKAPSFQVVMANPVPDDFANIPQEQ